MQKDGPGIGGGPARQTAGLGWRGRFGGKLLKGACHACSGFGFYARALNCKNVEFRPKLGGAQISSLSGEHHTQVAKLASSRDR